MDPPVSKNEWRSLAKGLRADRLPLRTDYDRDLVNQLELWLAATLVDGGVVVLFDALPGEPDLSELGERGRLRRQKISFAITRTPEAGFDLTVHPISVAMEQHRFGYRQPVAGAEQIPDNRVAVVLVPGLGFDRTGNRLGFGAGYYDRFLARLRPALKVGIADVLIDGTLPADSYDIPMTHIATPSGVARAAV